MGQIFLKINLRFSKLCTKNSKEKNNIWKDSVFGFFTKFYEISDMSDEDVFKLVKKEKIDIAVNLSGLTKYSRTSMFYNRVAAIQINYLGYPGTMGLKSIDYIIADSTVIPKTNQKHYLEKVSYLPKCYIPNSNNLFLKKSWQTIFKIRTKFT